MNSFEPVSRPSPEIIGPAPRGSAHGRRPPPPQNVGGQAHPACGRVRPRLSLSHRARPLSRLRPTVKCVTARRRAPYHSLHSGTGQAISMPSAFSQKSEISCSFSLLVCEAFELAIYILFCKSLTWFHREPAFCYGEGWFSAAKTSPRQNFAFLRES